MHESVPTASFSGVDISKAFWVSIVATDKSSVKFTKITARISALAMDLSDFSFFF